MRNHANTIFAVATVAIILVGVILRIAGLEFISMDMRAFVMRWYDQLARQGFSAMRTEFSNYTPPYLYLLWFATWTRTLLPEVTAIKLLSILFDVGNAVWVYSILRIKYHEGPVPFMGAAIFFALPTIILTAPGGSGRLDLHVLPAGKFIFSIERLFSARGDLLRDPSHSNCKPHSSCHSCCC